MQCLIPRLMLLCAALSLANCTTTADSYCQVYNQMVLKKGEGTIIASPDVKKRFLANELTYRSLCLGK
jgi:NAD(P)H-hydrate repair Nnr-like enzyme with NAD(P)H-hydrate dehydratase domain